MQFNLKAMPTKDVDYSCHIIAVEYGVHIMPLIINILRGVFPKRKITREQRSFQAQRCQENNLLHYDIGSFLMFVYEIWV